jgi:hypothetical protein
MLVPYPCDEIAIAISHVMFSGEAKDEVKKVYMEATGKLIIPQNRIHLPNQPRMNNSSNGDQ